MSSQAMVLTSGVQTRSIAPDVATVMQLAEVMYKGGLAGQGCSRPEHMAVKIIAGAEVGLRPIQAANNIMIVNGRTTIYGDGALALVRASGMLDAIEEVIEGDGPDAVAVCRVKRKGEPNVREFRFSVEDAVRAELWGKKGPWSAYPKRMLMWRARSWALRDVFGDVLAGLLIYEEQIDAAPESRPTVTTAPIAALLPATPVDDAVVVVSDQTLAKIVEARREWIKTLGISPDNTEAVKIEWQGKLHFYGVDSATKLSQADGDRLLAELIEAGKPTPAVETADPPSLAG